MPRGGVLPPVREAQVRARRAGPPCRRWLLALFIAWAVTAAVLLFAPLIARGLREKGTMAVERLMGMLLVMISVQMFLNGLEAYLKR